MVGSYADHFGLYSIYERFLCFDIFGECYAYKSI